MCRKRPWKRPRRSDVPFAGATYVLGFPDVFVPGVFDVVGAAQQLMHIGISAAHVVEWLFAIHLMQRRDLHSLARARLAMQGL
jgi:hypothetical protein